LRIDVELSILDKNRVREGTILKEKYSGAANRGGKRTQQTALRRAASAGQKRAGKRSIGSRLFWGFYKCLVVLSVLIVGVYAGAKLMIHAPEIQEPTTAPTTGGANAVLTGNTGEDPEERTRRQGVYNFVLLGKDVDSGNTDSIIVVSYDVPNQKVGMISIPRDTAVKRDWWNPKINASYNKFGPEVLKQEIEDTFGIPIDYYIYIDLKGFVALVDELGGVDVDIPVDMNYDDPYQDLYIHLKKGYQHLDGQGAMEAARYRHDNDASVNASYTDVGRAAMQRQILVALAKKVVSWDSLPRVKNFINLFQEYVKTDLSTADLIYFATQAIQVDMDTGVVQGNLDGDGNAIYKKVRYCFVFQAEDILPTLNELVNPYNTPLTEADLDLPKSEGTC
jgi:LCP family protein required for cell wall assembly